jgi:hypothetical protein
MEVEDCSPFINDDSYLPFYLLFISGAIIERGDISKDDRLLFFLSDCTTEPFPSSSVPPESISIQYSGSSMAEGGVITLEEGKLETVLCITRYSSLPTSLASVLPTMFSKLETVLCITRYSSLPTSLLMYFLICFRSWRPYSVLPGTAIYQLLLNLYHLQAQAQAQDQA